jgi:hypothetical protein
VAATAGFAWRGCLGGRLLFDQIAAELGSRARTIHRSFPFNAMFIQGAEINGGSFSQSPSRFGGRFPLASCVEGWLRQSFPSGRRVSGLNFFAFAPHGTLRWSGRFEFLFELAVRFVEVGGQVVELGVFGHGATRLGNGFDSPVAAAAATAAATTTTPGGVGLAFRTRRGHEGIEPKIGFDPFLWFDGGFAVHIELVLSLWFDLAST